MNATPSLARFRAFSAEGRELRLGETVSLDGDRRGLRLHCFAGQIWLTQAGDTMDYLITAGRDFVITRAGRVVIQALTPVATMGEKL